MVALANPAAVYCASIGGTYDVVAGTCTIGGIAYDAWALYYAATGVTPSTLDMTSLISDFMMPIMMLMMMMSIMVPMVKGMTRAM